MKASARASAVTSSAVIEFARRIQRKRASLSSSPLTASIAPAATGRSFLRSIGLGKADIIAGPEITLSKILQEWRKLDAHYSSMELNRGGNRAEANNSAQRLKYLNSRIILLEYRVFGNNVNEKYPEFSTPEEWLQWRLIHAHPEYNCDHPEDGWTRELFSYAYEDSKLAFDK